MKKFLLSVFHITAVFYCAAAMPTHTGMAFKHLSVADGLSQMSVVSIVQDAEGYLWFGTRDGLNRYDGYEFKIYRNILGDSLSLSDNYIKAIEADGKNGLWIGTANGLNHYCPETDSFQRYYINEDRHTGNANEINSICVTGETVWIGTYHGLFKLEGAMLRPVEGFKNRIFDIAYSGDRLYVGHSSGLSVLSGNSIIKEIPAREGINIIHAGKDGDVYACFSDTGDFARIDTADFSTTRHRLLGSPGKGFSMIKCLSETPDGQTLLFGTYDGLRAYVKSGSHGKTANGGREAEGLTHSAVESILFDRAGTLWIGTYAGGINYMHGHSPFFRHYSTGNPALGIISCMIYDPANGCIWTGTDAGGVLKFDCSTGKFFRYGTSSEAGIRDGNVKTLYLDGNLLYAGLYSGKICILDTKAGKWIRTLRLPNEETAIYSILPDNGRLLVGTYSPHGLKQLENGVFSNLDLPSHDGRMMNISQITTLCKNADTLWIGTRSNGVFRFIPSDNGHIDHFCTDSRPGISGNRISSIIRDSRGRILIGTSDGGLNIFENEKFSSVSSKDGLPDNNICSVIEDRQKGIWVITHTGMSLLDENDDASDTFSRASGIEIQEFSMNACTMDENGTIWVGGDNALLNFNPGEIYRNEYVPPTVITSVKVNNKPINIAGNENALSHNLNNLTFSFSALNFINPKENRYMYRLDGAEKEWKISDTRTANYTNLRPGKYEFQVMGSNNDGLWNEVPATYGFEIKAPVYARWWAIMLYVMTAGGICAVIAANIMEKRKIKARMAERQHDEEMYKSRIKLFTDFAHELRTPLTLIISPLEDILSPEHPQPVSMDNLSLIYRNAKRILLTVNQLMDLRSKEENSLHIRVAEGDFAGFAEEICMAFNHMAEKRGITYAFRCTKRPVLLWYDRRMFEKVIMNLLSNAFKFTADKGKITVSAGFVDGNGTLPPCIGEISAGYDVFIYVSDSGTGIAASDKEKIFDPFFRSSNAAGTEGSGVGLSLAKSIVEMHHGVIGVDSAPGKGSRFFILLKQGCQHFTEDEIIRDYKDSETVDRYMDSPAASPADAGMASDGEHSGNKRILVVEDNKELRKYMCSALSRFWRVIEAGNGAEGKAMAISYGPSIIISDVMMPEMDGLQMCSELKNDIRTAHIPIILLTARQMMIQMKEGLDLGADDYITKPFNMNMLILKIRNILASREKLKNLYGATVAVENLGTAVDTELSDEKFLQVLNTKILKFITDSELNVESLCKSIGMSRATLYRRITSATGLSPAKYILTVRLRTAARMLGETRMNITDIAAACGFSSIVHFSSSFKKKYGVAPSKYSAKAGDTDIEQNE